MGVVHLSCVLLLFPTHGSKHFFCILAQFLDKVEVEMRTCEEPRPPNGPSPIAITAGQRYSAPANIFRRVEP